MSDKSVLLVLESHAFVKMRISSSTFCYDEVSIRIQFKIDIRKSKE